MAQNPSQLEEKNRSVGVGGIFRLNENWAFTKKASYHPKCCGYVLEGGGPLKIHQDFPLISNKMFQKNWGLFHFLKGESLRFPFNGFASTGLHQQLGLSNCPLPAMILKANTAWSLHSYLAYTPPVPCCKLLFCVLRVFTKPGVPPLGAVQDTCKFEKRSHLSRRKTVIYIRRRWSKNLHQTFNVGILPMSLLGFPAVSSNDFRGME